MSSRVISAFSAYLLDSGYMYGVSLRVLLYFTYFLREGVLGLSLCTFTLLADEEVAALVVYNGGMAGSAWCDAPRAVFACHAVFTRCRQTHGFWHHGRFGRLRETVWLPVVEKGRG